MKVTKLAVAMVAALGISGAASAATITWSSGAAAVENGWGQDLSAGLFDSSGTLVSAENVGGSAYTFDGISFAAGSTVFAGGGTYDGFAEHVSSGWESALTSTGTWGPGGSASTVSLTGLTNLQEYRIQALVYDGRGDATITGRTVSFDGADQGQYANGVSGSTWGDGLLVTGTFFADATTTQDFTIDAFYDDGASNVSKGAQLNALTLYAIPEPATFGMVGAFGAALLFIRRKLMM